MFACLEEGGYLNVGFNAARIKWPKAIVLWPFTQLKVSQGGQLKAQILQRVRRLK